MIIRNLDEANRALLPYVPLVAQLLGKSVTLERIRPLMELLGNPQERLRVVHIAGTSGKTSTAYYMAALLEAGGQQTGLTVSPHIDSVAERVQIGGRPLPEAEFCAELGDFLELIKPAEQPPTYFELLYAFALWVFARRAVDYAVVETGMGGLYDATNVAGRPDKVCLITDIGFDHTHILGNSLAAIAAQKAGIIHRRNHVIMYEQAEEIMGVIHRQVERYQASLQLISKPQLIASPDTDNPMPAYQYRNWHLAHHAYNYLQQRDRLEHLASKVLSRTQAVQVPARMDGRRLHGKTLVMDGAHNTQKMKAFVDSFRALYPDTKPGLMIGLKAGKEYQEVVAELAPLTGRVITTAFRTTQDLPVESMDPEVLAAAFRSAGVAEVRSIADQTIALQALLAGPGEVAVITGSFYLLSQVRQHEFLV